MINLSRLNHYRQTELELAVYGQIGNEREGCFAFYGPDRKTVLRCVASSDYGWEHVSVTPNKPRTPTWTEMEFVKRRFFLPGEVCFQLHVAESKHINVHPNCLHIWRPLVEAIPLPPGWMVGPERQEAAS